MICAVAVISLISGLEAESSAVYVGLLAIAPFAAAAFGDLLGTQLAAALATGAAVLIGVVDPQAGGWPQAIRIGGIVAASALAVVVVRYRVRRDRQLFAVRAVAAAAQEAILFPLPPQVGVFRLAVRYQSAADGATVGGDLYDVAATPFGLRLILGDVRGKGLPAVRMASIVLGAFREGAQLCAELTDVVDRLDAAVSRFGGDEDFVTAAVLQFGQRDHRVAMIRCGHPAPVLIPHGGVSATEAGARGTTLPLGLRGLRGERTHDLDSFIFRPGDRLLLYTDGLTEARTPGGPMFGVQQVLHVCSTASEWEAGKLLERLDAAASRHAGGHVDDDVALLLVEHAGNAADT